MPALTVPTYDLGPGRSTEELIANVVIYGVLGALLLALAWIGWLLIMAIAEQRRQRTSSAVTDHPSRRRTAPEG